MLFEAKDFISPGLHLWQMCLALLLALGPIPLGLVWIRGSENGENSRSLSRNWLILGTVWCALETVLGLGLGTAGWLCLRWLLLGSGMLFAAGTAWWYRRRTPDGPGVRELLFPSEAPSLSQGLLLGAAFSVLVILLLRLSSEPITDYDTVAYHLPTMAQWVQTGHLARMAQFHDLNSAYPYNWELLCSLFLFPTHEDFLAAFPNLVIWALFGLAVYNAASRAGATRTAALAAGVAAVSMPEVLYNVNSVHVDLPMAAFFMAGICFAWWYFRVRSLMNLSLLALALGLIAGTKTSGILYAALLVALLGAGLLRRPRSGREKPKTRWEAHGLLGIGLLCALWIGGYWYGRNAVEYHNPLAPMKIEFQGREILPGYVTLETLQHTSLAKLFDPLDLIDWLTLREQIGEHFGAAFYVMFYLVLLGFTFGLLRKREFPRRGSFGLLGLLAATAYLHFTTPFSGDNGGHHWMVTAWIGQALRYGFPFCGLLAVGAALGATALGLPPWVLVLSGVAAALPGLDSWGMAAAIVCVIPFEAALLMIQPSNALWERPRPIEYKRVALLLAMGVPLLLLGTFLARRVRTGERVRLYEGVPSEVMLLTRREETIGYLMSNRAYYFFGPDLSRKVVFIPDLPLDIKQWKQFLSQRKISLVAIGPVPGRGKDTEYVKWLEGKNGPLARVYGNPYGSVALYYRKDDRRAPAPKARERGRATSAHHGRRRDEITVREACVRPTTRRWNRLAAYGS